MEKESWFTDNSKRSLILVVDDAEINRLLLKNMLEQDYNIAEASDGVEAVSMLEQYHNEIAIVLLDVTMPEMNGFEVLEVMQERRWMENVPVIMISAETSPAYVTKGFELGVTDYISRPFDPNIIKRRVQNTIALYKKQKNLEEIVKEQIAEKERKNAMMVNILSTIVEFRNGESGAHTLHIRVITELLLKALVRMGNPYELTPTDIAEMSNAAALHDIGKIVIPEEILNKPGKFTSEEFEIMKTHAVQGAKILENLQVGKNDSMVRYAHAICRWHHERWDGKGYPDRLVGDEIPICAQVVSLADVYDALTSIRVYKPSYSHNEAIRMITEGECGMFNPRLIQCLLNEAPTLEEQITQACQEQDTLFDVEELSHDLIIHKNQIEENGEIAL